MPLFKNRTGFPAGFFPLIDQHGRNVVVVIVKATYDILAPAGALALSGTQEPILLVDQHLGDPVTSAMQVPSDLVDAKPAAEVIAVRPTKDDALRRFQGRTISIEVGPVRFQKAIGKTWPFGPLRRDEDPRRSQAGTYDQSWVRDRMPLLPKDFSPLYNLAAPPDQVAPGYFVGDEPLRLLNVYEPGDDRRSSLPGQCVAVSGNVLHRYFTDIAILDTILVWAERPALTLVWRYGIPTASKVEEVRNIYVDPVRLTVARQLYARP